MTPEEARNKMLSADYAPVAGAQPEFRDANSFEYIALYLGEIEKHLRKIAQNSDVVAASVKSAAQSIPIHLGNISRRT